MNFNLIIHKGTDLIKFGMTSEEIQSILKIKPKSSREKFGLYDYEIYDGICNTYYEKIENKLVAASFEIIEPSKVYLEEIQLIGLKENKAIKILKKHFNDFTYDDISYGNSYKYDIMILIPDNKVYSVNIARKGYLKEEGKRIDKASEDEEKKPKTQQKYKCIDCGKIINTYKMPYCPKCNLPMMGI